MVLILGSHIQDGSMELAAVESRLGTEVFERPADAAHRGHADVLASEPAPAATVTACKTYPSYGVLLECSGSEPDGTAVSMSLLPAHQPSPAVSMNPLPGHQPSCSASPAVESKACGTDSIASQHSISLQPIAPRSGLLGCLVPSHHPGWAEPGPSVFSREVTAAAVAAARKSGNAAVGAPLLHGGAAPRQRDDLSASGGAELGGAVSCTSPKGDAASSGSSSEEEGDSSDGYASSASYTIVDCDIPYERLPDSEEGDGQAAAVAAEPARQRTFQAAAPASAFADSAAPATGNLSFAASIRGNSNVVCSPSRLQHPSGAIVQGALLPPPFTDRVGSVSAIGGQEMAELPLQPIQMSEAMTGSFRPGWQGLQSPRPRSGANNTDAGGLHAPAISSSGSFTSGPSAQTQPVQGKETVSAVIVIARKFLIVDSDCWLSPMPVESHVGAVVNPCRQYHHITSSVVLYAGPSSPEIPMRRVREALPGRAQRPTLYLPSLCGSGKGGPQGEQDVSCQSRQAEAGGCGRAEAGGQGAGGSGGG